MNVIEARNLTKFYGDVIGINDITLSLQPGIYGLVGPNGSGKSTFFKLMIGLLKPSMGDILVFGENVRNNRDLLRRIGFCPEYDSFYDFLTGFEFINISCKMYGFTPTEARRRSEIALEKVGLQEVMHKKITQYSKGMTQRLKVAQAIVHEPELLLLDEPLSFTDAVGRIQIMNLIKNYGRDGKSVIMATHILHEIEALTENFILMLKGRILATGNVHEVRELLNQHPHHIYIKCSNPRLLAETLAKEQYIKGLHFPDENGAIIIHTHQPRSFYLNLPAIIEQLPVSIEYLNSEDDNFDAVFKYLLRE